MSIYSNDNIRNIAKLTTRELPQKSKNAKITVRENNGLYSIQLLVDFLVDLGISGKGLTTFQLVYGALKQLPDMECYARRRQIYSMQDKGWHGHHLE